MRAYPFGIPSVAETATSSSTAVTSSFLQATITTASVALNILGPQGPTGPNVTVVGAVGPTGAKGEKGIKGLSIYLLSSSVATCLPPCDVGTVCECQDDLSVCTYQDGTYTGNNCTQEITYNQCDPGTCGLFIPGVCGA